MTRMMVAGARQEPGLVGLAGEILGSRGTCQVCSYGTLVWMIVLRIDEDPALQLTWSVASSTARHHMEPLRPPAVWSVRGPGGKLPGWI